MTFTIPNWNGKLIPVARSRGGTLATCSVDDNLVSGHVRPWPSAELLQKLCAADRTGAFDPKDYSVLTKRLGFYSDLQSLNSEDAMTWSFFGPLLHAGAEVRARFMEWLLVEIGISGPQGDCDMWLWRRVIHPDKPSSLGGPEIDFGLHTANTVILGEAKWQSKVGKKQGVNHDKDQIQLRHEVLERFGPNLFPAAKTFVVLGVGLDCPITDESDSPLDDGRRILVRNVSWQQLCEYRDHPAGSEISAYFRWKHELTCTPARFVAGTGIPFIKVSEDISSPR